MIDISKHITFAEATHTNTGLPNVPDTNTTKAMMHVAQAVFEPLRGHFDIPIKVTSFFRSKAVNASIGGVETSQHVKGEAMDIKGTKEMFEYIIKNLPFDQAIYEFGDDSCPAWIHVSLTKGTNRYQALRSKKVNGKTKYEPYT